MNTGTKQPFVSDLEEEYRSDGTSARLDDGRARIQELSVSRVDDDTSDHSACEEFDTRVQEPLAPSANNESSDDTTREEPDTGMDETLVTANGDGPIEPEDAFPRKHPRRIHRKTVLIILGKRRVQLALREYANCIPLNRAATCRLVLTDP
jgi:hypothetical protein